jgi:hypothetical protein
VSEEPKAAQNPSSTAWPRIVDHALTAGYLIAAAALLVWGGLQRFHLPPAPLIDADIIGYLGPAISALAGKPFLHLVDRSFPYPAFIYLILRVFGDFHAISVIQHLLGLGAGVLIMMAWNAAGRMFPSPAVPKPLFRYGGLVPAYVYLGSATAISFEHQMRPEAIFSFLTILDLWISFRFIETRFIRPKSSSLYFGALSVFLSYLVYLTKPSFGFAAIFTTLPVWLCLALPGYPIRSKAWLAAAAIVPTFLLLFLPEHILKSKDPWGPLFLAETLITVHANIVDQQMAEDLASNAPLPYPRNIVEAAHQMLSAELVKASAGGDTKTYPSLGFNPDYLMYSDSFCIRFQTEMKFSNRAMADFCMTYYLRALRHHPGAIAQKILRQLALFYSPKNSAYWLGKSRDLSTNDYARVSQLITDTNQLGPGNPAVARYVQESNQLASQGIAVPQARRFVEWLHAFSTIYLQLLAITLLSPLLLLIRPMRAHFVWFIAALWLAYSYNFGNCLTIAIAHSLEVTRYNRSQLIFTAFAEALTFGLLLELAGLAIRAAVSRFGPKNS